VEVEAMRVLGRARDSAGEIAGPNRNPFGINHDLFPIPFSFGPMTQSAGLPK